MIFKLFIFLLLNMLENLKGIMLEDIKVDKKTEIVDEVSRDLIKAQITPMAETWDNSEDEAWDEL